MNSPSSSNGPASPWSRVQGSGVARRLAALLTAVELCLSADMSAAELAPNEAGFAPIFNGKDLTGWDGEPGWWRITIHVKRKRIQSIEPSKVSPMPEGLLNTLDEDEILDLAGFLLSGGDPRD